jgi:rhodanese-related sulfurtransferase
VFASINEIDAVTLHQMQQSGEEFQLIDCRSPMEISQGKIEGGIPMPLHLLPMQVDQIARDKKVVIYCRSGARSAQACYFLAQNYGIDNAYNLRGGIISWAQSGLPIVR